jgi:hypothetical protein
MRREQEAYWWTVYATVPAGDERIAIATRLPALNGSGACRVHDRFGGAFRVVCALR